MFASEQKAPAQRMALGALGGPHGIEQDQAADQLQGACQIPRLQLAIAYERRHMTRPVVDDHNIQAIRPMSGMTFCHQPYNVAS